MGKAWRWDKQTFKRTVIDTVLDKVIRELFGSDDRPQRRRIGGARSPKKPQRQRFTLEAIEPRLLLSADLTYPSVSSVPPPSDITNTVQITDYLNGIVTAA